MKKYRFKNILLFSLILLSQIHAFFRGMDFGFLWILNDIYKSASLSVFLFVKHLSEFILIYYLFRPKGVNRNLILFFLVVTFFDLFHFVAFSGFGFEKIKLFFSLLVFLFIKSKYCKWRF